MKNTHDILLSAVTGGTKGCTSKYDIGQRVRVIDGYGNEVTGIITEAMFDGGDLIWLYIICDDAGKIIGSFCEDTILGAA